MAQERMIVRDLTPISGAKSRTILWTDLPAARKPRNQGARAPRDPRHMSHVDRRSITQAPAWAARQVTWEPGVSNHVLSFGRRRCPPCLLSRRMPTRISARPLQTPRPREQARLNQAPRVRAEPTSAPTSGLSTSCTSDISPIQDRSTRRGGASSPITGPPAGTARDRTRRCRKAVPLRRW